MKTLDNVHGDVYIVGMKNTTATTIVPQVIKHSSHRRRCDRCRWMVTSATKVDFAGVHQVWVCDDCRKVRGYY